MQIMGKATQQKSKDLLRSDGLMALPTGSVRWRRKFKSGESRSICGFVGEKGVGFSMIFHQSGV